jgi:hypothetical protein
LHSKAIWKAGEQWKALRRGWYAGGETFAEKLGGRIQRLLAGRRRESHSGAAKREHGERAAERSKRGYWATKYDASVVKSPKTVRRQFGRSYDQKKVRNILATAGAGVQPSLLIASTISLYSWESDMV